MDLAQVAVSALLASLVPRCLLGCQSTCFTGKVAPNLGLVGWEASLICVCRRAMLSFVPQCLLVSLFNVFALASEA